ncbi:hypothetical protein [uncultured Gammaproteobacteria bacterium]|nr:hypothetical protein [uncultured Gammaproteobacteria bacterium]
MPYYDFTRTLPASLYDTGNNLIHLSQQAHNKFSYIVRSLILQKKEIFFNLLL